jgi:hypothetical protein
MTMYALVVPLKVKPEMREKFLAAAGLEQPLDRAAPGAVTLSPQVIHRAALF